MTTNQDSFYQAGVPPWDVGRPQDCFIQLHLEDRIGHLVLDVGCGTGALSVWLAEQGSHVIGIDLSPTAIERARKRDEDMAVTDSEIAQPAAGVDFAVWDSRSLMFPPVFDSVVDSGLLGQFRDEQIHVHLKSVFDVLKPGGTYNVLCWSDLNPLEGPGPRRFSLEELGAILARVGFAFGNEWCRPTTFARSDGGGNPAWFATVTKP